MVVGHLLACQLRLGYGGSEIVAGHTVPSCKGPTTGCSERKCSGCGCANVDQHGMHSFLVGPPRIGHMGGISACSTDCRNHMGRRAVCRRPVGPADLPMVRRNPRHFLHRPREFHSGHFCRWSHSGSSLLFCRRRSMFPDHNVSAQRPEPPNKRRPRIGREKYRSELEVIAAFAIIPCCNDDEAVYSTLRCIAV
jgi:hypothetical protein